MRVHSRGMPDLTFYRNSCTSGANSRLAGGFQSGRGFPLRRPQYQGSPMCCAHRAFWNCSVLSMRGDGLRPACPFNRAPASRPGGRSLFDTHTNGV
jgi:hypothetical protein